MAPTMITVVTGPPCAGKTTYVDEHRRPTDLVLDLDAIAHALGNPPEHVDWTSTHPAIAAARAARGHVLYSILNGKLTGNAWVIDARPTGGMRAQYERADARFVHLDPGELVCVERARDRGGDVVHRIHEWYRTSGPAQASALSVFG